MKRTDIALPVAPFRYHLNASERGLWLGSLSPGIIVRLALRQGYPLGPLLATACSIHSVATLLIVPRVLVVTADPAATRYARAILQPVLTDLPSLAPLLLDLAGRSRRASNRRMLDTLATTAADLADLVAHPPTLFDYEPQRYRAADAVDRLLTLRHEIPDRLGPWWAQWHAGLARLALHNLPPPR